MKACPQCQRLFGDEAGFCPVDGTGLLAATQVAIAPDATDPRIGTAICGGRYQVRRVVADGGMGRVYQALDLAQGRSVALKVLHAEVAQDDVQLERFKREFSLSAELPHDYIVEVLDFQQTDDGSFALVMEYLEGEELRMLLKREKILSPARTIRMVAQLARGLDEAHRQRFVHRDIKPDNIFLGGTASGDHVKLLDFGSVRDNTEGAKKLTILGTTIGSPYYMSPEQAQGLRELDHRADVWSVAAIAYECLTGKLPFPGSTGPAILLAILSHEPEPPSIAGRERGLPEALDDILSDALAKDMKTRIGSLGELADRIGACFGLRGGHLQWLQQSEAEIGAAIEQAKLEQASRPGFAAGSSPYRMPEQELGLAPPGGAEFGDEEFAMGVPQGPPWGVIAIFAVALALLAAGIAAYLLLT